MQHSLYLSREKEAYEPMTTRSIPFRVTCLPGKKDEKFHRLERYSVHLEKNLLGKTTGEFILR